MSSKRSFMAANPGTVGWRVSPTDKAPGTPGRKRVAQRPMNATPIGSSARRINANGYSDPTTRTRSTQQCTQALSVDNSRSLAMSGMPCKPGCMTRSRHTRPNVRREEAYRRQREANDAAAAVARERAKMVAEAERSTAANRDLQLVWGGREDGLARLRDISRQLEKLHRAERALLHERDELVHALRRVDFSWALLSVWSGLSRQALSKRPKSSRPSSA